MIPGFGAIHRMIFWELLRVFLLSLVGLTGIFLLAGVAQQASQWGLSAGKIVQIIPLLIPSSLPYTIPATILFASCVAYGRVSNDNEVVAMKAAGIDLYTILRPAILLGLLGTAAVMGVAYSVIPQSQLKLQEELIRDPEEFLYNQLKRERSFRNPASEYALYVRDVQGQRLIDVIIKRKSAVKRVEGVGARVEYDSVARAREAVLHVDLEGRLLYVDSRRMVLATNNNQTWVESVDQERISIPLPEMFNAEQLRSRPLAMDWDALPPRAAELARKRDEKVAERERNRAAATLSTNVKDATMIANEDLNYANEIRDAERNIRNVQYEYYVRPALAASCLVFALIGCPVGIWFNRSDYLSTFVVCFIPTVMLYYPLLLSGGGMSKDGKVPMAVGVWGANAVVGSLALVLILRLLKR